MATFLTCQGAPIFAFFGLLVKKKPLHVGCSITTQPTLSVWLSMHHIREVQAEKHAFISSHN